MRTHLDIDLMDSLVTSCMRFRFVVLYINDIYISLTLHCITACWKMINIFVIIE